MIVPRPLGATERGETTGAVVLLRPRCHYGFRVSALSLPLRLALHASEPR